MGFQQVASGPCLKSWLDGAAETVVQQALLPLCLLHSGEAREALRGEFRKADCRCGWGIEWESFCTAKLQPAKLKAVQLAGKRFMTRSWR